MFEIIKTYGNHYQQHWWQDLFNIIFRIFDNMKLPELQVEVLNPPVTCHSSIHVLCSLGIVLRNWVISKA